MPDPLILLVAGPIAAYLIGSIPFGVIIARTRGVNLRTQGSGNIGATNVGRVIGKKWGYVCFVLDVGKGVGPVLAAKFLLGDVRESSLAQAAWLAVALGAIMGHVFSLYLKFRGGKGVATSLGVLLGFYPYFTWPGLAGLGVWLIVVLIWRHVSLASIAAAGAFPILFIAFNWPMTGLCGLLAFAAAMAALIIVRHRGNISRLLAGTENRIGGRKAGG